LGCFLRQFGFSAHPIDHVYHPGPVPPNQLVKSLTIAALRADNPGMLV
jgi:hypothetical protein